MRYGFLLRPTAMALVVATVVGCASEAPTTALIPDGPQLAVLDPAGAVAPQTPEKEYLEVCKRYQVASVAVPASTNFNFASATTPALNQPFSITSGANNTYSCRELWADGGNGGNVTVTEPAIDGFLTYVTRQELVGATITTPVNNQLTNTATGLVSGNGGVGGLGATGQLFLFTNVEEVNTGGCSLTQGYWKTHSAKGPAPYDAAWLNIGALGQDTPFYTSGKTWYELYWTPPAGGNVYIQLAHQYMAAKLNVLNGAATTPAVVAAISGAEAFFGAVGGPTTVLTTTQKNNAKSYAATLASYNEGTIGPGHCGSAPT